MSNENNYTNQNSENSSGSNSIPSNSSENSFIRASNEMPSERKNVSSAENPNWTLEETVVETVPESGKSTDAQELLFPSRRCSMTGIFDNPEIKRLSKHWFPFLILGVTLMILGFLAIGSSFFVTILTVAVLGVLLLIGGIMQVVNAFYTGKWSGFMLHLMLGLLYLVVGYLLLDAPMLNAISLTFLLACFFIVMGLFRIIGSLTTRFPGWGWSLFSGMITFLLGILIYKHWPSSGLWVIGMFVGIEMIFSGWYWVMFSSSMHAVEKIEENEQKQKASTASSSL